MYDASDLAKCSNVTRFTLPVRSVAWGGARLVAGCDDAHIKVVDVKGGDQVCCCCVGCCFCPVSSTHSLKQNKQI